MFGALFRLWRTVVYFVVASFGDSGTEFEVEYEVNPSSISVQSRINGVDVAPGFTLIVISDTIFISVDSLEESVQGKFCQFKGFEEKSICVIKKSDRLVVRIVVLVAISVVGYALNFVGFSRLVTVFVGHLNLQLMSTLESIVSGRSGLL